MASGAPGMEPARAAVSVRRARERERQRARAAARPSSFLAASCRMRRGAVLDGGGARHRLHGHGDLLVDLGNHRGDEALEALQLYLEQDALIGALDLERVDGDQHVVEEDPRSLWGAHHLDGHRLGGGALVFDDTRRGDQGNGCRFRVGTGEEDRRGYPSGGEQCCDGPHQHDGPGVGSR